jgi:hypothetical protein
MPSFLRTSAGTEIWPCAVTLDCGIDIILHYQGNGVSSTDLRALTGVPDSSPSRWTALGSNCGSCLKIRKSGEAQCDYRRTLICCADGERTRERRTAANCLVRDVRQ